VVLATTLMLAALLAYIRASGLRVGPMEPRGQPARVSTAWFGVVLALWLIAIFTRENAVLLPAILAAFDLAFGGWAHLRARWRVYLFFGVIALGFAGLREAMHIAPLPDVYARRPDGDFAEYAGWL